MRYRDNRKKLVEWVTSGELDGEPEPYDDQTEFEVLELED